MSVSIPMSQEQFITHFMREKYVFFERYNESLNMHMDDVNKIYCHSALIERSLKKYSLLFIRKIWDGFIVAWKSLMNIATLLLNTRTWIIRQKKVLLWMNFSTHEALAVTADCLLCLRHKKGDLFAWRNPYRSSLCHLLTFTLNE